MKTKYTLGALTVAAVCALTSVSCSEDEAAPAGGGSSTTSYAGPGSDWRIDVNDSAFTLKELDNSVEASGTFETLSSGFLKLTIEKSNGATGAPSVNATTYGLNVPDFMFLMQPFSGTQLIPMIVPGTCPTGGFTNNFMAVNANDSGIGGTYGNLSWDSGTGVLQLDTAYTDGTTTGASPSTLTTMDSTACSDAVFTSGNYKLYYSHSGGSIINTDTSNSGAAHFMFGLEVEELANYSDLDGNWYGLAFDEALSPSLIPVSASITSTASDATASLTAIDPGTGGASGSLGSATTLTFTDKNFTDGGRGNNGMFTMDYATDGADGGCMADVSIQDSTSKRVILCSAPSTNGAGRYNLILVYKAQ